MASPRKLYSNSRLFVFYGLLNLLLLLFLLTLIILLFNEIYIFPRAVFVLFIGVQTVLVFFIRIQFLQVTWNDEAQTIEFLYNKKFGIHWRKKATAVTLPLVQFDGYSMKKDGAGLKTLSFFKLEKKERFELGPFHVGIISAKDRSTMEETFGESL
ncbi:MAG: hypothetical protein U5K79_19215 [Cyclobacteriaceae bacterium]|nr:hypothetical protein [Cyclobacteriaceae bacterium]